MKGVNCLFLAPLPTKKKIKNLLTHTNFAVKVVLVTLPAGGSQ